MTKMTVSPCSGITGEISVPGDKSISHRSVILSAIAQGKSTITGFLRSEDCLNTLKIVEQIGADVVRADESIEIGGCAGEFSAPDGVLDCGNSGTGMRLLAGLLAGQAFESVLTGDASLNSRPMKRISDPLRLMGAHIDLTGDGGTAPMTIKGGGLQGIAYELPMASAQVKSCVLLAGLFAEGDTTVVEPKPTRDHTERMLIDAGAEIQVDGLNVKLIEGGGKKLRARDWVVPGDFSSAAFWLVCAASHEGSELHLRDVGLNPRRTALIGVLQRMGADIAVAMRNEGLSEPMGDITVKGTTLSCTEIGGAEIPNLIDEIPVLAVAAALGHGRTVIKDAQELRVKESDRIAVMVECLSQAGVTVEETDDGMIIEGMGSIRGGVEIDSCGDHRVAMAMSIAGLCSVEGITVKDTDCILTSYPSFWDDLNKVAEGCCA